MPEYLLLQWVSVLGGVPFVHFQQWSPLLQGFVDCCVAVVAECFEGCRLAAANDPVQVNPQKLFALGTPTAWPCVVARGFWHRSRQLGTYNRRRWARSLVVWSDCRSQAGNGCGVSGRRGGYPVCRMLGVRREGLMFASRVAARRNVPYWSVWMVFCSRVICYCHDIRGPWRGERGQGILWPFDD